MSMEATPGDGRDGLEPSGPVPADGLPWDEDAWLKWMMAEAAADEAAGRVPDEGVQDAWVSVAGWLIRRNSTWAGLRRAG